MKRKACPIPNTGDGVATNEQASRLLCLCYGLDVSCYHCAPNSYDLVMKRMIKSKTMPVPVVVQTYDCLQAVIKIFLNKYQRQELE